MTFGKMSNRAIHDHYYDLRSPGSFDGINRLQTQLKGANSKLIKDFLHSQKVNNLHKFARKNFLRRKITAPFKNYMWQADLIQMDKYSRQNKGYKYVLTVIDVCSRFAFAKCLKTRPVTSNFSIKLIMTFS